MNTNYQIITFNRARIMEISIEDDLSAEKYECTIEEIDSLKNITLKELVNKIEEQKGFSDSEVTLRLSYFKDIVRY